MIAIMEAAPISVAFTIIGLVVFGFALYAQYRGAWKYRKRD